MSSQKAVVIGTGFGGLAAAVRLLAKGYDVTVLEKNADPGGRARQFVKDGFKFDAGPTVITAPYLIDELFELLGRKSQDYMTLLPVDPFYRVQFPDGTKFDYVGDSERLHKNIAELSPRDVAGYQKLFAHAQKIFKVGYQQLADVPFTKFSTMLKIAPQMIRLQNFRTVYGLVSKYIKNEKLRQVFSFQPLLVGGNPFTITSIYLLIHPLERLWGVHFAKGGTFSIVKALVKLLNEFGAPIEYNKNVAKIDVTDGKVTGVITEDGQRYDCDIVVTNGDPSYTYLNQIDPKWLKANSPRKVRRKKQSMSLFVLYFGTNREFPDLQQHTIVLGPRYKGLLKDIFKKKTLAKDFSLYLHASKRTDPDMYPEGQEGFYVLSPVPNNLSETDWETVGPRYADTILEHLDKHVMPGLSDSLVTQFFITPDYFEKSLSSVNGAAFGLEPLFSQSAYFRYHNKSQDVDGLYFVGASTHPGAGVPGVLNSAKVLDRYFPDLRAAATQPNPTPKTIGSENKNSASELHV